MNDVGSIALEIIKYSFPDDTSKFPIQYVSGWLEAHVGEFNALTHEDFYLDETGAFQPCSLDLTERNIFKYLYEINYYDRAAREALRGIVWSGPAGFADSLTMVREGDSTIQKTSKHQISRTFAEFAKDSKTRLDDLLFQYNRRKSEPRQVHGDD